jgi:LmbE family N-acetylglucosaminyl deacetylase
MELRRRGEIEMSLDVLAFGAHPHDVEIWCGGPLLTLKDRGYRTGIVDLTVGDMGSRGSPEVRRQEPMAAANALNLWVEVLKCHRSQFYNP